MFSPNDARLYVHQTQKLPADRIQERDSKVTAKGQKDGAMEGGTVNKISIEIKKRTP